MNYKTYRLQFDNVTDEQSIRLESELNRIGIALAKEVGVEYNTELWVDGEELGD